MKIAQLDILIIMLLYAVFTPVQQVHSQSKKMYKIHPASEIKFKGKSNINRFTFRSETVDGRGCIDTTSAAIDWYNKPIEDAVNGFFIVDVKSFKSGNNRMNQDMYQALKSERHPNIEFNLKAVDFRYLDTNEALFTVYGYLQVAGVENLISFQVKVSRAGKELYRLQGDKEIYMSDYDIEPPEALFGLVQTRDKLTVEFNLIAGLQSGESLASRLPCDKLPAYLQWGLLEQDINRF